MLDYADHTQLFNVKIFDRHVSLVLQILSIIRCFHKTDFVDCNSDQTSCTRFGFISSYLISTFFVTYSNGRLG